MISHAHTPTANQLSHPISNQSVHFHLQSPDRVHTASTTFPSFNYQLNGTDLFKCPSFNCLPTGTDLFTCPSFNCWPTGTFSIMYRPKQQWNIFSVFTHHQTHPPTTGPTHHRRSHRTDCTGLDPTNFWESNMGSAQNCASKYKFTWNLPSFQPRRHPCHPSQ